MKKVLLMIAVAVFTTTMVSSQGRPQMNPQEMAKRQTDAIKERVKLSDDQFKQVFDINLKSSEETMKILSGGRRDMEALTKINNKKDSLIKCTLTPEQIKLYDEYLKERREARRAQGLNR